MEKGSRRGGICYLCGLPGSDSRDHVVARAFLKAPFPTNLLTLESHHRCQAAFSGSEDYVRNILAGMADDGSKTNLVPGAEVQRAINRNPVLREDLARGFLLRADMSDEDLPVDVAGAIRFDRERFYPSLEKIVRGLHFHHVGRRLAATTEFRWTIVDHPSKINAQLEKMLKACQPGLTYAGSFESSYALATELCMWTLRFYRAKLFVCLFPR